MASDHQGWTASTVGEERLHNPRLAGKTEAEYVSVMHALNLPNPKMMVIAVPANLASGKA